MNHFSFQSQSDALEVHGTRWQVEKPKAIVVISHGMAEHIGRYARFAQALNDVHFDVWGIDHRAHGRTLGPHGFGDFGDGGWDGLVSDLDQLVDLVAVSAATTGQPIILFSHSMGAAAAQHFVQRSSAKIDMLILSGTTARKPEDAVPQYNSIFEPARTPYDWLSRDAEEVDRYILDPLCGFEGQTIRNGFDRADTRRIDPELIALIRKDLPVLLLAGDADPVNNNMEGINLLESLWRQAGIQKIDRQVYAGGRHEMLNETNRDEVTKNVIGWMQSVLA